MHDGLDWSILYWIQDNLRNDTLDGFFRSFTRIGNRGVIWLLMGAQMALTKKLRNHAIILVIGLSLGVLIGNMLIKNLVLRDRPCWIAQGIDFLLVPRDYSFPSGHALSSTIAAIIITAADRRAGFVAIPVAVLIAFSRMYLFVHFPTDVFGGVLIAIAISAFMLRYLKKCVRTTGSLAWPYENTVLIPVINDIFSRRKE